MMNNLFNNLLFRIFILTGCYALFLFHLGDLYYDAMVSSFVVLKKREFCSSSYYSNSNSNSNSSINNNLDNINLLSTNELSVKDDMKGIENSLINLRFKDIEKSWLDVLSSLRHSLDMDLYGKLLSDVQFFNSLNGKSLSGLTSNQIFLFNLIKDVLNDRIKSNNNGFELSVLFNNVVFLDVGGSLVVSVPGVDIGSGNEILNSSGNIQKDNSLDSIYGIENMLYYKNIFIKIISNLKSDRIYKFIMRFQREYVNASGEECEIYRTSPSFFIHSETNIDVVLYRFSQFYLRYKTKYNFDGIINIECFVKDWLHEKELTNFSIIVNSIKKSENNLIVNSKKRFVNIVNNDAFISAISVIWKSILGENYGTLLSINDIINIESISSKKDSEFDSIHYYHFFLSNTNYILKVSKKNNVNSVDVFLSDVLLDQTEKKEKTDLFKNDFISEPLNKSNPVNSLNAGNKLFKILSSDCVEKWIDYISYENFIDTAGVKAQDIIVKRFITNMGVIIYKNNLEYVLEIFTKCKKLEEANQDLEIDNKIGSLDMETYNDSSVAGGSVVYCIATKINNTIKSYYLTDYANSDLMCLKCIDDLMIKENHCSTIYSHNFSGFDGIFLLGLLLRSSDKHDYKIKLLPMIDKDDSYYSITLTKTLKNKKVIRIIFADSLSILDSSLDTLAKTFNCQIDKGFYPYKFINKETLNYIGNYPGKEYFEIYNNQIKLETYNRNLTDNKGIWNTKLETEKYIIKDVEILYDIMHRFSQIVFDKYFINITKIRTAAGLAMLIYRACYYKPKFNPIHFIKGSLDIEIRKAYIGGIVDVIENYTDKIVYKYDVNSHYPNNMLQILPGGIPRVSTEKELKNIFGFVTAEVTAPSVDKLKVAFLPVKDINGNIIMFRGTITGHWFSEELKQAVDYGYTVNKIISCIQFEKSTGTFDKFVKDLYNEKNIAKKNNNLALLKLNKMLLNSLYGRLGLRDQESITKIIDFNKFDNLNKKENIELLSSFHNKWALVRSYGRFSSKLINLLNSKNQGHGLTSRSRTSVLPLACLNDNVDNREDIKNTTFFDKKPWGQTESAVQYAAAITAYARMFMNQFKNLKDNLYIGGDTDSVILEKPLDPQLIGEGLGQFKLEHIIKEGFFLSKKSYLIKTINNEIFIKCKGIKKPQEVLNYDTFVELFKGNDVKINQIRFHKDKDNFTVKTIDISYTIKGLNNKIINYTFNNRSLILKPKYSLIIYSNKKTKNSLIIYKKEYLINIPIIYLYNLSIDLYKQIIVRPEYPIVPYIYNKYDRADKYGLLSNYLSSKSTQAICLSLPSTTSFSHSATHSLFEKDKIRNMQITLIQKQVLLANRFFLDIKAILNELKNIELPKGLDRKHHVNYFNERLLLNIKSKIFYVYDKKDIFLIRKKLIKYLNKLDLFDILWIVKGAMTPKRFWNYLDKVTSYKTKKINKFKFNFKLQDLTFNVSIKFLGKINYKIQRESLKHEVLFEIIKDKDPNVAHENRDLTVITHTNKIITNYNTKENKPYNSKHINKFENNDIIIINIFYNNLKGQKWMNTYKEQVAKEEVLSKTKESCGVVKKKIELDLKKKIKVKCYAAKSNINYDE